MRILSGIQPSGELHLGNYLGALRHWVAQQNELESFYLLADLHAITVAQDPQTLRERTLQTAALLLAIGLDPARSALFVQSHISEHPELAWILNCFTGFGELQRMTQFKDKAARRGSATVGLFAYPVLQAADILLYQADRVPVGEDQKQHLELTRDLAARFNTRFGPTFNIPEPAIAPLGARIMDLQDPRKKMSKSGDSPGDGTIWLTDTPDAIRKKIRSAVTDSESEVKAGSDKPAITNLLTIYSIVSSLSVEGAEQKFAATGYAKFKDALADMLIAYLQPVQERLRGLASGRDEVTRVLQAGAEKASPIAARTLNWVKQRIGLLPQ